MTVELYGLEKCDTCRKARNWLDRQGIEYRFVDYREQRVEPATLRAWAAQVGGFDRLINRASTTWRNLPDARKSPGSEPEWLLLVREHPALVKRPVLVREAGGVHLGFRDADYKRLFGVGK